MPEFITIWKGDQSRQLRVSSYGSATIDLLDPANEPDPSEGLVSSNQQLITHEFSRLNGRCTRSWGRMLEGWVMAPESLIAVHPLSFRLDAVRRFAEHQMSGQRSASLMKVVDMTNAMADGDALQMGPG